MTEHTLDFESRMIQPELNGPHWAPWLFEKEML